MKKFLISHMWWITLLIALFMLIAHTISYDFIEVDNISIVLLVVMLLSPFTTAITKIKIGDFEAEVNPEEIRRIKEDVESRKKDIDDAIQIPEMERTIENIKRLAESDPVLALAKLRIELEKILNKLNRFTNSEKNQRRPLSAGQLVYKLQHSDILPLDVATSTREVISICNRAIHGEDIRQQDVKSVVEIGATVLRELTTIIQGFVLEPQERLVISDAERLQFENAKYKITTIIPLVENPYKVIRVLDQIGLDELLEGYDQYAEFIVDIRKVETNTLN